MSKYLDAPNSLANLAALMFLSLTGLFAIIWHYHSFGSDLWKPVGLFIAMNIPLSLLMLDPYFNVKHLLARAPHVNDTEELKSLVKISKLKIIALAIIFSVQATCFVLSVTGIFSNEAGFILAITMAITLRFAIVSCLHAYAASLNIHLRSLQWAWHEDRRLFYQICDALR